MRDCDDMHTASRFPGGRVMFNKKTVTDIDVHGKRVLVRVDYQCPD